MGFFTGRSTKAGQICGFKVAPSRGYDHGSTRIEGELPEESQSACMLLGNYSFAMLLILTHL
jgi:hypothetical protein